MKINPVTADALNVFLIDAYHPGVIEQLKVIAGEAERKRNDGEREFIHGLWQGIKQMNAPEFRKKWREYADKMGLRQDNVRLVWDDDNAEDASAEDASLGGR